MSRELLVDDAQAGRMAGARVVRRPQKSRCGDLALQDARISAWNPTFAGATEAIGWLA